MAKVYGVFSEHELNLLLRNCDDFQLHCFKNKIYWYNRELAKEYEENIHCVPEIRSNNASMIDKDNGICFFLYLDDALDIARLYNRNRIISMEIDEEELKNHLFLREFWYTGLYGTVIYHYIVPNGYLSKNLERIKILDDKFIKDYDKNEENRNDNINNYPSVQRDYLTSLVTYYPEYKLNQLSYHLASAMGVDDRGGSVFLTLAGSLLYPSMNWLDTHITSQQQINRENIGLSILHEALNFYDWNHKSFSNYSYSKNQVLLPPTETTLYHILTDLMQICGSHASYSEIFKNISDEELKKILETAAQKTFDYLYIIKNGIIRRRTDEAIEPSGISKQLKLLKRN